MQHERERVDFRFILKKYCEKWIINVFDTVALYRSRKLRTSNLIEKFFLHDIFYPTSSDIFCVLCVFTADCWGFFSCEKDEGFHQKKIIWTFLGGFHFWGFFSDTINATTIFHDESKIDKIEHFYCDEGEQPSSWWWK